jgi:hypothetical protein
MSVMKSFGTPTLTENATNIINFSRLKKKDPRQPSCPAPTTFAGIGKMKIPECFTTLPNGSAFLRYL